MVTCWKAYLFLLAADRGPFVPLRIQSSVIELKNGGSIGADGESPSLCGWHPVVFRATLESVEEVRDALSPILSCFGPTD